MRLGIHEVRYTITLYYGYKEHTHVPGRTTYIPKHIKEPLNSKLNKYKNIKLFDRMENKGVFIISIRHT